MPLNCYKCSNTFGSVNDLIKHMRNDHLIRNNSNIYCKQNLCLRLFYNFNSFRKHLHTHITEIEQCANININDDMLSSNQTTQMADVENVTENTNNLEMISKLFNDIPEFNKNIFSFVTEMYNNSLVPRKFVQFVIDNTETRICKGVIKGLEAIVDRLSQLNEDEHTLQDIKKLFQVYENCVTDVNTEYKCVKLYKELDIWVSVKDVLIANRLKKNESEGGANFENVDVHLKMVSLSDLLKKVLKKSDNINKLKSYISDIQKGDNIISNFVQGGN